MSKAPINENGSQANAKTAPGANGRAADGKFAPGNRSAKGNPFGRRLAAMRQAVLNAVSEDDVQEIMSVLLQQAKEGDVAAAKLVLQYAVGKPALASEPDRVEVEEWRLRLQGAVPKDEFMTTLGRTTAAWANDLMGTMQPVMHRKMMDTFLAELKGKPSTVSNDASATTPGVPAADAPSRNGSNGGHRSDREGANRSPSHDQKTRSPGR
jgi:hypothetical protein